MVDGSRPAPTAGLLGRKADVVQIVLVEELGASIRTRRPGQRRDRVDDELEVTLARGERLLGAFALIDVDEQVVPADDVPVRIPKRRSARLNPAVDTIKASSPYFHLEGLAGCDRMREMLDSTRGILRMCLVAGPPTAELVQRSAVELE